MILIKKMNIVMVLVLLSFLVMSLYVEEVFVLVVVDVEVEFKCCVFCL